MIKRDRERQRYMFTPLYPAWRSKFKDTVISNLVEREAGMIREIIIEREK